MASLEGLNPPQASLCGALRHPEVASKPLIDRVCSAYRTLEARFNAKWSRAQRATYTSALNFEDALALPIHRWYRYKEGFSPRFVQDVLSRRPIRAGELVFDPFCGVGTTLVEAQAGGYPSVGFEVNPFASFVAKLKTAIWEHSDQQTLSKLIVDVQSCALGEPCPPPDNKTVVSYYDAPVLEPLLSWKRWGKENIRPGLVADSFRLAWLQAAELLSSARKAGNGLKRRRTSPQQAILVPDIASDKIRRIITQVLGFIQTDSKSAHCRPEARIVEDSALHLAKYVTDQIGTCITSPPYANCFDYTKIYLCELWMGDFITSSEEHKSIREKSLRSHVHFSWRSRGHEPPVSILVSDILPALRDLHLWTTKIPTMLEGYFSDLYCLIRQLSELMVPGGIAAFAVSNPVYGGIPIAVDLFLAEIAEAVGFETVAIEADRTIIPSSQQFVRLGENAAFVRESNVLIRRRIQ